LLCVQGRGFWRACWLRRYAMRAVRLFSSSSIWKTSLTHHSNTTLTVALLDTVCIHIHIHLCVIIYFMLSVISVALLFTGLSLLADRTNGHAYGTVLCLSVVCRSVTYVLWLNGAYCWKTV